MYVLLFVGSSRNSLQPYETPEIHAPLVPTPEIADVDPACLGGSAPILSGSHSQPNRSIEAHRGTAT